ncbi:SDR family NAD(P)-dependent oxidoreductase [Rugosimonospora africana]|uniref:Short-chain dehydrogenase/reductase n=1 Tax=Rugosimonospora africana TaxID=556532 RepID=A0A8J3QWZ6_9ACTN|nr:SDR family NAD(P)-dependent oxidoreductase [Rugosimonospora africana]GIH16266.1 short-chain dehydrogenase/reductase [Rugosimonospora africana]
MVTDSRAILITGAGAGIGLAAARALVERGFTVYAGLRGPAPAELAGAVPVTLDVTDPDSVARAAEQVADRQRGQGLHAIVNNAGVIVQGPLELVPEAELRRQFEVNVYGPVRVMRSFLPQLRQGRGRIVNVTAPTARVAVPFAAPISASKAALAALSDAVRLELAPWGLPVVQVVPGGTATEIFAKADRASVEALATVDPDGVGLYRSALDAVAAATARQRLDPVATAVRAVLSATLDARPKTHYVAGNARVFAMLARLPMGLRDRMVARALGLSALPAAS